MKKENYVTLVMGTIGGLIFALGMCMCLLPEWGVFNQGVVVTAIGAVVLLAMLIVRRKMVGKKPIKVNPKTVGKIAYGVISSLVFGTGMGLVMAFEGMMFCGIIVGIVGIGMLLGLIPMCLGIKKED